MRLRFESDLPLARTLEWTFHKRVKGGWYLIRDELEVFMTEKEAGTAASAGQTISAYVYRDSEGRLTARRRPAILSMGDIGFLTVVTVGPLGAFLDWGLPKHLLLPRTEWHRPPQPHSRVQVRLLLDEENRPTATQRIWESLEPPPSDLPRGTRVSFYPLKSGTHGILGAIDSRWRGFLHVPGMSLPNASASTAYFLGTDHQARGRISFLSPEPEGAVEAEQRLATLARQFGGLLPLNEDSPPEKIWEHLRWSKNEFKKILDTLDRQGKIQRDPRGLRFK